MSQSTYLLTDSVADSGVDFNDQLSHDVTDAVDGDMPDELNQNAPSLALPGSHDQGHQNAPNQELPGAHDQGHQNAPNQEMPGAHDQRNPGAGDQEIHGAQENDINQLEEGTIRLHYDNGKLEVKATGILDIQEAKAIKADFMKEIERIRKCATCFRNDRAAVNLPCRCYANCLECADVMVLCSCCQHPIERTELYDLHPVQPSSTQ